jgi:hypothetical protein
VLVGLLICIPVVLLGALPAEAWRLADRHLSTEGTAWAAAHAPSPHVAHARSVTITGNVRGPLSPGVSRAIDLKFDNPSSRGVTLGSVRVTLLSIAAPQADAGHVCTPADFRVRQMRSQVPQLPAAGRTDLAGLGVPLQSWPRLKMRSRPVNQDGCKGAHLTLGYRYYGVRWR